MAKQAWSIRTATSADANALSACMQAAYEVYTDRFEGSPLPPMTVDYAAEIENWPVWVVESGEELAGGLILMPESDHLTLANVAVHPAFQGQGLGRALMDKAEDEARRQGYSTIRLATHPMLTENIDYYTRLGWTETQRDEKRVFMEKTL